MKHNQYNTGFEFVKSPENFSKYDSKEFLSYCLGATLYMPATKKYANLALEDNKLGLSSMAICFEDAIEESDLPAAEINAIENLNEINKEIDANRFSHEDLPLIFFRVRSPEQFIEISGKLTKAHFKILTGFIFPKFSTSDGSSYYSILKNLNESNGEKLYGMPILEGRKIAFNETREIELAGIKNILDNYKELVLNVRVGATDFSACFGVRRGIDYSIYDIIPVRDCLADILNFFSRDNDYVISGPVWEYFLANKDMKFDKNLDFSFQSSLLKRKKLVDEAIDGLLREVIIDKANGFIGKTAIHPTHIKYINAMQAVTEEEYDDAIQILETSGGVIKSGKSNKMNEINPHRSWAEKIYYKAKAYGVIKDESSYIRMVFKEDI